MAYDINSIAKKLLQSRNNMAITKSEVNQFTGISVNRLTELESGKVEPTGDEILILSDVYKEDFRFFISNQNISSSDTVNELYRVSDASINNLDRQAIQHFIYNSVNEQLVWDCLGKKTMPLNLPKLNQDRITKADGIKTAKALRAILGYTAQQRCRNLYSDFRKIGIHIFRMNLNNSGLSGLFIKHPMASKCILVNYDENVYRQNFTLCHEVGHALMDGLVYNVSFEKQRNYREYRANAFASEFLMPRNILNQINIKTLDAEKLVVYACQFRVNVEAFLIALKSAELITESKYHHLRSLNVKVPKSNQKDFELEDLSDRLRESYEMMYLHGLTPSYVRLCHEAYMKSLISQERLSQMFDITIYELPALLDAFKLKLNNEEI